MVEHWIFCSEGFLKVFCEILGLFSSLFFPIWTQILMMSKGRRESDSKTINEKTDLTLTEMTTETELGERPEDPGLPILGTLFHGKSDQVLVQVTQEGGGISILADITKLSGYGHGPLALGDPLELGFGPDDHQRSCPTSVGLGFCETKPILNFNPGIFLCFPFITHKTQYCKSLCKIISIFTCIAVSETVGV